jgi:hypothetical protein
VRRSSRGTPSGDLNRPRITLRLYVNDKRSVLFIALCCRSDLLNHYNVGPEHVSSVRCTAVETCAVQERSVHFTRSVSGASFHALDRPLRVCRECDMVALVWVVAIPFICGGSGNSGCVRYDWVQDYVGALLPFIRRKEHRPRHKECTLCDKVVEYGMVYCVAVWQIRGNGAPQLFGIASCEICHVPRQRKRCRRD